MIDSVAWATVCTYGASLSALDRKVFREIKNMDRDASYLVLAHQVLFAGRNTQSLALEGPAPKPNTLFKLSDPTAWIYSLNKSRLYKTIQFFPLHLCLTPAVGTGHRCSDENPAFPFMDESIYDPEFLVYYLLILLRYHPCNVAADRKFLRLFFSHHCFAVLVVMLSSECPYMREGAFQCLDIFSKRIFLLPNIVNEDFPEMRLVRWLSTLVQNIFSEQDRRDVSSGKTQLAPIVARLFAEYANVLTVENHQQPSALSSLPSFSIALYSELVKILISHSTLISNDLPIFTNFWFSTIPESAPVKRSFILKILRQGMKNSLDEEIFRKRHIIEHLLVHLLSISSASCLPDMVAILEIGGQPIIEKFVKQHSIISNLFILFSYQLPLLCSSKNELVMLSKSIALDIILNLECCLSENGNLSPTERIFYAFQHASLKELLATGDKKVAN